MKKNENSPKERASQGQILDIVATVNAGIPPIIYKENAQNIIGAKGLIIKDVRAVLDKYMNLSPFDRWIFRWVDFYSENFDLKINPSEIVVNQHDADFTVNQILVISRKLSINEIYDKCAENMLCKKRREDFDKKLWSAKSLVNLKEKDSAYLLLIGNNSVLGNIGPYSGHPFSYLNLKARLLLELFCVKTTGTRFNTDVTICEGSEGSWHKFPHIIWKNGTFKIKMKAISFMSYFIPG